MKKPWILVTAVIATAAIAGQLVDQGQPGKQGAWPVSFSSTVTVMPTPSSVAAKSDSVAGTSVSANAVACSTVGGASCTIIYGGSTGADWSSYQNLAITVINTGSNALTNCLVEWSPDSTHWEIWDSTTFAALSAGVTKSLQLTGNSRIYLRLEGQSAAGTTITVYITVSNRSY